MNRWKVNKAYGIWYAIEHGWGNYQSFSTWREAMDYADRQAQPTPNAITIKDHSGALCDLTATIIAQRYIHLKAGDDVFSLAPHEWKPLALFLLDVDHTVRSMNEC